MARFGGFQKLAQGFGACKVTPLASTASLASRAITRTISESPQPPINMKLLAVGLNHKTAPIEVRERLTFGPDIIAGALRDLKSHQGVHEAVVLSTCNRTELYCAVADGGEETVRAWLGGFHGIEAERLNPYLYAFAERDAILHLLRVASGLDSMVLGEPQILGQVKGAFQNRQPTALRPASCFAGCSSTPSRWRRRSVPTPPSATARCRWPSPR